MEEGKISQPRVRGVYSSFGNWVYGLGGGGGLVGLLKGTYSLLEDGMGSMKCHGVVRVEWDGG